MFIVFSGLPGVGKTTIARELAKQLPAVFLRIDSLEQALANSGVVALHDIGPGGYMAAAALAIDNLRLGFSVVADSVNPWPLTRDMWRDAAGQADARFFGIEVTCGDAVEHRRRVEARQPDLPGQIPPGWDDVLSRDYAPWTDADLRLDTAVLSPERAVEAAVLAVRAF